MASVREIAEHAGVSIATVSRALNDRPDVDPRTRDRILATASRVGYAVRKAPRRAVGDIAMVHTEGGVVLSEYDSYLLRGIQQCLQKTRLGLSVVDLQRERGEDEPYAQFFERRGITGLLVRTGSSHRHVCHQLAQTGIPMVVLAERFDDPDINFVRCDSRAESQKAVDHLIHLGHVRIALVIHRRADGDHRDREEGYLAALAEHGIAVDPALIVRTTPNLDGGMSAINQLMVMPKPPTAIYCTDPWASVGLVCRAQDLGIRIPDELSIIGFDDGVSRKRVYPRITAVCQNTEELGYEATSWLVQRLGSDEAPPCRKVLSAYLEINQTTGGPTERPARILPNGVRLGS